MGSNPAVTSDVVKDFVGQKRLALAGASRTGKKFGNVLLRELRRRGYDVVPVHPVAREIDGLPCARDVAEAAARVDGLVVCAPPAESAALVREAAEAGLRLVWLQQGAGSDEAVAVARERGVALVYGHCLLMFLSDVHGIHRFHRGLWGLLGKLPAPAPATTPRA